MTTKTEEKNTFQNDFVSVKVHRKPKCMVEYEVDASRAICVEAHKKAAKSVGKEVVVPGFRKGKAPPEIVAKRYPHELDKRWQEAIANRCYQEAAQLANIPVISPDATINFKMQSYSRDGAKLTLSFETIPSIPTIDPAKCVLEEIKRPEVNKEKTDETIRQTQMFFGEWGKVEDRPVKEGDFVILDVDIIEEEPPQKLFTHTRFEITDKAMAQWMKKLILGKKPGDVLEGVSEPDPSLSEEEKKEYPPKKVRVSIKQIDQVKLPELNDEFAKKLGVEDLKTLEKKIEEILNKKADEQVREEKREQVTDFLLSHHFELPSSVIQQETKFRLEQMITDPHFKSKWDASTQKQKEEMIDQTRAQAEKAVRIFYLCRKIAANQNIEVTPKDIPLEQKDPIESLLYPSATPHDPRQPDVKQAETYSRVLLEKTEDWVIAHARTAPAGGKKKEQAAETKTTEKPKKKAAPKKTAAKTSKPKQEGAAKPKRKTTSKPKKDK